MYAIKAIAVIVPPIAMDMEWSRPNPNDEANMKDVTIIVMNRAGSAVTRE